MSSMKIQLSNIIKMNDKKNIQRWRELFVLLEM